MNEDSNRNVSEYMWSNINADSTEIRRRDVGGPWYAVQNTDKLWSILTW
jgi:hypothetical protein